MALTDVAVHEWYGSNLSWFDLRYCSGIAGGTEKNYKKFVDGVAGLQTVSNRDQYIVIAVFF